MEMVDTRGRMISNKSIHPLFQKPGKINGQSPLHILIPILNATPRNGPIAALTEPFPEQNQSKSNPYKLLGVLLLEPKNLVNPLATFSRRNSLNQIQSNPITNEVNAPRPFQYKMVQIQKL